MHKIGRTLAMAGVVAVAGVTVGLSRPALAQVSGRLHVADAGGRTAPDLGDAVIYLEGRGARAQAGSEAQMAIDARQFRPRVLVVPAGTTVQFPNQDPFNHNVFSVSEGNAFDLGLYNRGETRHRRFARAGLVRIFCNIHPRMSAFIVVRDNAWYAQPVADGSFTIPNVPAGRYTLHVWHERAPVITQPITVPDGGLTGLQLAMDASGFRWVQHRDKYGREYGTGTARERY